LYRALVVAYVLNEATRHQVPSGELGVANGATTWEIDGKASDRAFSYFTKASP
jgi:hypothetical protein